MGGGCGLFAVIGVVLLVILLVTTGGSASTGDDDDDDNDDNDSQSSSDDDDDDGASKEENTGGDVMAGAVYKRIPSTNVEVPVPPGWRESRRSLYTFALSNDGNALLAFTTVSSYGEFNGRLQHATKVFRITGCSMGPSERVRVGPNQLRSRLKEGECTFNGVRAHVATVLVESGRRAHPLVIYAVDNKASERTAAQAKKTISQMRKR
ncbi:MAG: hypothetical protein DRI90_12335 [Deltaproteobacteria bacterium]|nr:MAG: hypothetical protein DRI90_12335 [Deltaproteobacteria bacterium]